MNQLTRTVEHITAWEKKQISDFQLFKELKAIIYELSDEVIRLETEKASLQNEIMDLGLQIIGFEEYVSSLRDSIDSLIRELQKNGI